MRELNVVAIIPSLNPDEKLINYVHDLIKIGFKKIIIPEFKHIDPSKFGIEIIFAKKVEEAFKNLFG